MRNNKSIFRLYSVFSTNAVTGALHSVLFDLILIFFFLFFKDNSFSVKSVERKQSSIKLQVEKTLPKETYCKKIEFKLSTGDSLRTDTIKCKGNVIKKPKTIKKLESGVCYQFEISVTTKNNITIGPQSHFSCTSK